MSFTHQGRQEEQGELPTKRRTLTVSVAVTTVIIALAVSWLAGYNSGAENPSLGDNPASPSSQDQGAQQPSREGDTDAAASDKRSAGTNFPHSKPLQEKLEHKQGSSELSTVEKLADLRVRRDRGAGGYDRSYFGEPWADEDLNGCDTRNDILRRDLEDIRFRKGSHCVVNSGVLHDPYVGVTIHFKRGPETSPLVQIDHVVALGDAWRAGASDWTPRKRQEFANDPENLLAVEGQANQDKESSRADQWMPPREEYWCAYVSRQIDVKYAWDLTITEAEREAMIRALSTCPPARK